MAIEIGPTGWDIDGVGSWGFACDCGASMDYFPGAGAARIAADAHARACSGVVAVNALPEWARALAIG